MDVSIEFYPISVARKIVEGLTKMYIFGRDKEGKQYCLIDTYYPYFYVLPHGEINNIKNSLSTIEIEGIKPAKAEIISINFGNKEKEVIKIIVNKPQDMLLLKKQIELLDVGTVYDQDIGISRKYVFDKKITFLVSHNVVGTLDENHSDMKCPIIHLKSIEEIGGDIYKPDVLAINIETYNPLGKEKIPTKDPIVMISFVSKNYRKVITWKHFKTENKDIEIVSSEEELITRAREIIDAQKPDVIVGYRSDNFDFPYLKHRALKYRINFEIGLDFSQVNITDSVAYIAGICHIDLFKVSRFLLKAKSSKLDDLISEMIPDNDKTKLFSDLIAMWNHGDVEDLCEHYLMDTEYILKITQNYMGYLIALTKFIGLSLFDVSRMSARQLVEGYLIRTAKEQNVIIPNKPSSADTAERLSLTSKKEPYIKTKPGLYSQVISFNFEALYPAIIAAHNISSESMNCNDCNTEKISIDLQDVWFCKNAKGFIPTVLDDLLSRIFRILDILKGVDSEKKKKILLTRMQIIKDISNAFYLNFSHSTSRWYNRKLYDATLYFGYKYIHLISEIIREKGFEIIYCDAQKMYICMEDKTNEDVSRLVEFINISLPGIMEMRVDTQYERALFLDDNNKVMLTTDNELKVYGFEHFTKDFCFYAKNAQVTMFRIILRNNSIHEALTYIRGVINRLKNHQVPVDDLIIYRVLSRNIEEYTDNFAHVEVAKDMRAKNYSIGPGSVIKYVIIWGIGSIHQRAKIPSEIKKENIDSRYYIEHQILPCVEGVLNLFGISRDELLLAKTQSGINDFK
jgi:DNA polymerase I